MRQFKGLIATIVSLFLTHEAYLYSCSRKGYFGQYRRPAPVFTEVNKFLKSKGKPLLCTVQLVGLSKEISVSGGKYTVHTDALTQEVANTDLISIPALDGDMVKILAQNQAFVPWIVKHYQAGAEVASLCVGAFLLAATGLITGRKCATPLDGCQRFQKDVSTGESNRG
jgi:putative intracellular protease/amidase